MFEVEIIYIEKSMHRQVVLEFVDFQSPKVCQSRGRAADTEINEVEKCTITGLQPELGLSQAVSQDYDTCVQKVTVDFK